jgi:hypothetical protein
MVEYGSYLGGSAVDFGNDVAEYDGSMIVVGRTTSPDFPTNINALSSSFSGIQDQFLAIFSDPVLELEAAPIPDLDFGCDAPEDGIVIVDSIYGASGNLGSPLCPVPTIAEGQALAVANGLTEIHVLGGLYNEIVELESGLTISGIERWGALPPILYTTTASSVLVRGNPVTGAFETIFEGFALWQGGIYLDSNDDSLTIAKNLVIAPVRGTLPLFVDGSSNHFFKNNTFYHEVINNEMAVYIANGSHNNLFENNTLHSLKPNSVSSNLEAVGFYLENLSGNIAPNIFMNNIVQGSLVTSQSSVGFKTAGVFNGGAEATYNLVPTDNDIVLDATNDTDNAYGYACFSDPQTLLGPGGWDYTLQLGCSDAYNAGNPDASYDDTDGSRNDMGAFGGNNPNTIVF